MGGNPLIGPEVIDLLYTVWDTPQTTKSTLAKAQADEIAIAACAGLITVQQGNRYGRVWRITPEGMRLLWAALNSLDN